MSDDLDETVLGDETIAGDGPPPQFGDDPDGPAAVIDKYRIVDKLGEGGMGEVYVAEQFEPVRRKVALKVIKKGMDTRQVVTRFENERQALAMMDHPCIAKVLDAGATPRGRPYFVMEYVPGVPITEHCDAQRMGLRDRLQLFMQACEGVQHAHHKAIIHRDIKPSNVLVGVTDGVALPKIIDFGIAKATEQPLTDATMQTAIGQLMGTPEYMSPEQAEMTGPESVDTRTDVYALGVVLYELLVGALPFEPTELRRAGFDEIRRKIREDEPEKPSTRFGRLGERTTDSARVRGLEPSTLSGELRGDLDWITMKALEKDRDRRYGSPSELSADLRRYLDHEPVEARPPSKAYRVSKFVRRHRVGVAVASGIAVLLVGFAISMGVLAKQIATQRDRANLEAETSLQVSNFLVDLFEVSDPGEALGNTITAREILDRGSFRIQHELGDQPQVQGRLMDTMGEVYRRLGLYDQAAPLLENSVAVLREHLGGDDLAVSRALEHLGTLRMRTGQFDAARELYDEALRIRIANVGEDDPSTASVWNNLGSLALFTGDLDASRDAYGRALAIYEAGLGPEDPSVAHTLTNLAIVSRRAGDPDGARARYDRALGILESAYGPDHPEVAQILTNLGSLHRSEGDLDGARTYYERAVEIRERVLGPDHADLARTLNNLGNVLEAQGEHTRALEVHGRALGIRETAYGENHPTVAQSLSNLAISYASLGEYDAARGLTERAIETRIATLPEGHRSIATGYYNLAAFSARAGARDDALVHLAEAVDRGFIREYLFEDPDLESIRDTPEYREIAARVREELDRRERAGDGTKP